MAGVNYLKIKDPAHVGGILSHCASPDRGERDHDNREINGAWSYLNQKIELKDGIYFRAYDNAAYYQRFKERLSYLDAQEGANRRKDRVVMFGLEVSVPEDMTVTPEDLDNPAWSGQKRSRICSWSQQVMEIIAEKYGRNNVVAGIVHFDEVHQYDTWELDENGHKIQTGTDEDGKPRYKTTQKLSRPHLHVYVVPEVEGKLNGKAFSSPQNMRDVNERIQVMSLKDYNCKFMDGTKRRSRKTVEELKLESSQLEMDRREKDLMAREIAQKARESDFEHKAGNWAKNVEKRLKTALTSLERSKNDYDSLVKSQREDPETVRIREFIGQYKIKGRSMLDIYDEQRAKEADDVHKRARDAQSSAVGLPDEVRRALISADLISGTGDRQDGSDGQSL